VSTAYARIGFSGDYGISWLLTRAVGSPRARDLMYRAERIDAARCEAIGLVTCVVPDEQLQEEAFTLARSLADGPRIALGLMKDNLDDALDVDFLTALDREAERMVLTGQTEDHLEAVQAFREKRSPVFAGR
jgi:enoyl-CoA hydratase/carnithine racemase